MIISINNILKTQIMEKKPTYRDAMNNERMASAIPLAIDGKTLPQDTAASVVMLQVGWSSVADELRATMTAALKKMKKEGYDERSRAIDAMEDVNRRVKAREEWDGDGDEPQAPTEEELEAAAKARESAEEFYKEKEELEAMYNKAWEKESARECRKVTPLTRRELADIIGMLGVEGTISVNVMAADGSAVPIELDRREFISDIAATLVG